jgi:hypothetical protein
MAIPKSLYQPFRRGQLMVGGAWRAYFAPFNAALAFSQSNSALGPAILDLQVSGPFTDSALPALGFTDLGWITKFKLTPASKIGMVRSGYRGAVRAMYRGQVGESFELSFREASRMSWKISTGAEMFNLLSNSNAVASTLGPLSSSGATAVPMGASGYNAAFNGYQVNGVPQPVLFVTAGSGAQFSGQYIVCDQDFNASSGFGQVGAAAINIFQNAVTDIDFIRKTSDFVARVALVIPALIAGQDGLVLSAPFIGGGNSASVASGLGPTTPQPGAKIQAIKGYAAREGGSYITEWSAVFICQTIDNSQICVYYPHVAPNQFKDIAPWTLENAGTTDLTGYELDAVFEALAFDDPIDGETVVRYCAYYPAPGLTSPQI